MEIIVPHIIVWGSCFSLASRRGFRLRPASAPPPPPLVHSLTPPLVHSLTHSPHLTSPHSPHLTSPHFTHLTSPHLTSPTHSLTHVAGAVQIASWQAQYIELPGCLSRRRRSTQSLLEELRRAWPPLGRGCLSRGRRST